MKIYKISIQFCQKIKFAKFIESLSKVNFNKISLAIFARLFQTLNQIWPIIFKIIWAIIAEPMQVPKITKIESMMIFGPVFFSLSRFSPVQIPAQARIGVQRVVKSTFSVWQLIKPDMGKAGIMTIPRAMMCSLNFFIFFLLSNTYKQLLQGFQFLYKKCFLLRRILNCGVGRFCHLCFP